MSTALTVNSIKWGRMTTLLVLYIFLMMSNSGQVSAKPQDIITLGLDAFLKATEMITNTVSLTNRIFIDTSIGSFGSDTEIGSAKPKRLVDDADSDGRRLKRSSILPDNNNVLTEMKSLSLDKELHTQPQYKHLHRNKRSPCNWPNGSGGGDGTGSEVDAARRRRLRMRYGYGSGKRVNTKDTKKDSDDGDSSDAAVRRKRRQAIGEDPNGFGKSLGQQAAAFTRQIQALFQSFVSRLQGFIEEIQG